MLRFDLVGGLVMSAFLSGKPGTDTGAAGVLVTDVAVEGLALCDRETGTGERADADTVAVLFG